MRSTRTLIVPILRVVDDEAWPSGEDGRVAPWPVVAVDLLDADDERSRRAGLDFDRATSVPYPVVDREPVQLPTLVGHDDELWDALIELSEVQPGEWTLIGRQMVFLHAIEHGAVPPRVSTDQRHELVDGEHRVWNELGSDERDRARAALRILRR